MCEYWAGELILSYDRDDTPAMELVNELRAGNGNLIAVDDNIFPFQKGREAPWIESLGDRVEQLGGRPNKDMQYQYYLLRVPPGQESWHMDRWYRRYAVLARDELAETLLSLRIGFNSILSIAANARVGQFSFDEIVHDAYVRMMGWDRLTARGAGCRVAILDSGISVDADLDNIVFERDCRGILSTATDGLGHGTAVASIVHKVAPEAELSIYKVIDDHGTAREWDVYAALYMIEIQQNDVINMSFRFGLPTRECAVCGRQSHSVRSAHFERMIGGVLNINSRCIMVAAAGNDSTPARTELPAFPARFRNVLAIVSVDAQGRLSSFSNRGAIDEHGDPHPWLFCVPGGESDPARQESIGAIAGRPTWGTSYAAAYASGAIACLLSDTAHLPGNREMVMDFLIERATDHGPEWNGIEVDGYQPSQHGNGILRIS